MDKHRQALKHGLLNTVLELVTMALWFPDPRIPVAVPFSVVAKFAMHAIMIS